MFWALAILDVLNVLCPIPTIKLFSRHFYPIFIEEEMNLDKLTSFSSIWWCIILKKSILTVNMILYVSACTIDILKGYHV